MSNKQNAVQLSAEQKRLRRNKRALIAAVAGLLVVVLLLSALGTVVGVFGDELYIFDLDKYINNATLVWSDEFDGAALDTSMWNIEGASGTNNMSPRRGGYWAKDAISVRDGNLVISTTRDDGGVFYTGAVTTAGKYDSRYGYYEVRCILPRAYGIWAAFWMMPSDGTAFRNGNADAQVAGAEIDILEAPVYPSEKVQQAVHVGGYDKAHRSIPNIRWLWSELGDIYDSYHTYGVYWNEEVYIFTVDGKKVWTTNFGENVSQVEEFLFLSVEVGGSTGENGVPVVGNTWDNIAYARPDDERNDWSRSADYVIDYVRHYQWEE